MNGSRREGRENAGKVQVGSGRENEGSSRSMVNPGRPPNVRVGLLQIQYVALSPVFRAGALGNRIVR